MGWGFHAQLGMAKLKLASAIRNKADEGGFHAQLGMAKLKRPGDADRAAD